MLSAGGRRGRREPGWKAAVIGGLHSGGSLRAKDPQGAERSRALARDRSDSEARRGLTRGREANACAQQPALKHGTK